MRIIKLLAAIFAIGLFITGCNDEVIQPPISTSQALVADDYWAKDNFDLSLPRRDVRNRLT